MVLLERWLVWVVRRCTLAVASDLGRCAQTSLLVRPGKVLKKPASINLDPGAGYGAETCPVEESDDIPFFSKE